MQENTLLGIPKDLRKIIFKFLKGISFIAVALTNKQLLREAKEDLPLELQEARMDLLKRNVVDPVRSLSVETYNNIHNQMTTGNISTIQTKKTILRSLSSLKLEKFGKGDIDDVAKVQASQKKLIWNTSITEKKSLSFDLNKRRKELEQKLKEMEGIGNNRSTL